MALAFALGARRPSANDPQSWTAETEEPVPSTLPRDSVASPSGAEGWCNRGSSGPVLPGEDFLDGQGLNSTERKKSFRREGCGDGCFSGHVEGMGPGQELLVRNACHSWKCEYCSEVLMERYRAAITARAIELDLATFVTLTLDRSKVEGNVFDYINWVWNRMLTRLRRGFLLNRESGYVSVFGAFPYIRVLELQRDGTPHFHVLLPRWLMDDEKWFVLEVRKAWEWAGGGAQIDAEVVSAKSTAAYVTKALASYLTKESMQEGVRDGVRRVTTSVGMRLLHTVKKMGAWVRYSTPLLTVLGWRRQIGAIVREQLDFLGEVARALVDLPVSVQSPGEDQLFVGASP